MSDPPQLDFLFLTLTAVTSLDLDILFSHFIYRYILSN